MCGIWAILGSSSGVIADRNALVKNLLARGPEYMTLMDIEGTAAALGFTRLAINGLTPAGHQPFVKNGISVVCNGEIYNYKELAERWAIDLEEGTSDCAVLPTLASRLPPSEFCRTLDGVFAFVLVDRNTNTVLVARDPYGVRPLFHATFTATDSSFPTHMWSSELKGIPVVAGVKVEPFPPGTWARYDLTSGELLEMQKYHSVPHVKIPMFEDHRWAASDAERDVPGADGEHAPVRQQDPHCRGPGDAGRGRRAAVSGHQPGREGAAA